MYHITVVRDFSFCTSETKSDLIQVHHLLATELVWFCCSEVCSPSCLVCSFPHWGFVAVVQCKKLTWCNCALPQKLFHCSLLLIHILGRTSNVIIYLDSILIRKNVTWAIIWPKPQSCRVKLESMDLCETLMWFLFEPMKYPSENKELWVKIFMGFHAQWLGSSVTWCAQIMNCASFDFIVS